LTVRVLIRHGLDADSALVHAVALN